MRKVTKEDWEVYHDSLATTCRILEDIKEGQSPNLHYGWIALLYKKFKLGDWNQRLPSADSIEDKTYLMWDNECYCLYHLNHEKFGKHIIECAHPYAENVFVFFDYSSLKPSFDSLDAGENLNYIPIYHAHPRDRYDFQMGEHMWE
jgi:hypothetical protein